MNTDLSILVPFDQLLRVQRLFSGDVILSRDDREALGVRESGSLMITGFDVLGDGVAVTLARTASDPVLD